MFSFFRVTNASIGLQKKNNVPKSDTIEYLPAQQSKTESDSKKLKKIERTSTKLCVPYQPKSSHTESAPLPMQLEATATSPSLSEKPQCSIKTQNTSLTSLTLQKESQTQRTLSSENSQQSLQTKPTMFEPEPTLSQLHSTSIEPTSLPTHEPKSTSSTCQSKENEPQESFSTSEHFQSLPSVFQLCSHQEQPQKADSCNLEKQKLNFPSLDLPEFLPWMVTQLCMSPHQESEIQGCLLHFCENDSRRHRLRDCFPNIHGLLSEQQDTPKFVMARFLHREIPFNPEVDVTGAALTPLEGRLFRCFAAVVDRFPTLDLPRLLFESWRFQLLSESLNTPARCSHIRVMFALMRRAEISKAFNWRSQTLIILSELAAVMSADEAPDLLAAALSVYPELAPYPTAEVAPQVGHLVSTAMAVTLIEMVKKEEENEALPLFWRICRHCNWPGDFRTELGGTWSCERLQHLFQTSTARHTADWLRDETFFGLRLVASLLGWHWTYAKLMRPLVSPLFSALPQLPTTSRCGLIRLASALGSFCNHSSGADQMRDLMAKLSVWFRDGEATRVQQEVRPVELGAALDCLLDLAPFQPHITATAATCWLNNLQWAHAEAGGDRSDRIRSFAVIFQEDVTFVHNALVNR